MSIYKESEWIKRKKPNHPITNEKSFNYMNDESFFKYWDSQCRQYAEEWIYVDIDPEYGRPGRYGIYSGNRKLKWTEW